MDHCYLCGKHFNEDTVLNHREHIIQNAIGGVLVSDDILCRSCGSYLGKSVDAPFEKMFSSISKLLKIRIQRKSNKRSEIVGKLGEIDAIYDLNSDKIYPKKPFFIYDEFSNVLKIFAGEHCIKNYSKLQERNFTIKKKIKNITIVNITDLRDEYSDKFFFPFNINSQDFKRGIAKIAIGFACKNNISRIDLPNVLDCKNKSLREKIEVIPFVPCNLFDQHFEEYRYEYEENFPQHNLLLFSEMYAGKRSLICFIELFSTFQFYVILNDDYKGDECFFSFGQYLLDTEYIKVDKSIDYKLFYTLMKNLQIIPSECKDELFSLFLKNSSEAIEKLNDYLYRERLFYNYEDRIRCYLNNMIGNVRNAFLLWRDNTLGRYISIPSFEMDFLIESLDRDQFISFLSCATNLFTEADSDEREEIFLASKFRRVLYLNNNEYSYCDYILTHCNTEQIRNYCHRKFYTLADKVAQKMSNI